MMRTHFLASLPAQPRLFSPSDASSGCSRRRRGLWRPRGPDKVKLEEEKEDEEDGLEIRSSTAALSFWAAFSSLVFVGLLRFGQYRFLFRMENFASTVVLSLEATFSLVMRQRPPWPSGRVYLQGQVVNQQLARFESVKSFQIIKVSTVVSSSFVDSACH